MNAQEILAAVKDQRRKWDELMWGLRDSGADLNLPEWHKQLEVYDAVVTNIQLGHYEQARLLLTPVMTSNTAIMWNNVSPGSSAMVPDPNLEPKVAKTLHLFHDFFSTEDQQEVRYHLHDDAALGEKLLPLAIKEAAEGLKELLR